MVAARRSSASSHHAVGRLTAAPMWPRWVPVDVRMVLPSSRGLVCDSHRCARCKEGFMTRSTITLLPALLCFAYFCGGVPFYWLHRRRAGVAREARIETRRRSPIIPKWLIYYLLWLMAPIER